MGIDSTKDKIDTGLRSRKTTTATVQTRHSKQESERDSVEGLIPYKIIIDSSSYASEPSSPILELTDQKQVVGITIQKAISEAPASISENDQKTRPNITNEIEEESSTDYSREFKDETTLKEKSFQELMHSVSLSDITSMVVLDKESLEIGTYSSSLLSHNHSFSKITLGMVTQHMEEETVRSRHKISFPKIKEKASIDKAKKQVRELDKIKQEYLDMGQANKMPM